jgi:hypothetical protein
MLHGNLYVTYYTTNIEILGGPWNLSCQYANWRWGRIALLILTLTSSLSCGFVDWNLMCDTGFRVLGLPVRSEKEVKAWLDEPRSSMLSSARLPCGWRRGVDASKGKNARSFSVTTFLSEEAMKVDFFETTSWWLSFDHLVRESWLKMFISLFLLLFKWTIRQHKNTHSAQNITLRWNKRRHTTLYEQ